MSSSEDNVPKLKLPQDLRELLEGSSREEDREEESSFSTRPSSPMANNLLSRKHAKRTGQSSPMASRLMRKKFREQTPPPPSTTPPFVTPEKRDHRTDKDEFEDATPSSPMASMMLSRKHNLTENGRDNSRGLSAQQHNVLNNMNRMDVPPSSPFATMLMARKRPRKNKLTRGNEEEDSLDFIARGTNSKVKSIKEGCNSPKDIALLVRKHTHSPPSSADDNAASDRLLSPPPPPSSKKPGKKMPAPIPFPSLS